MGSVVFGHQADGQAAQSAGADAGRHMPGGRGEGGLSGGGGDGVEQNGMGWNIGCEYACSIMRMPFMLEYQGSEHGRDNKCTRKSGRCTKRKQTGTHVCTHHGHPLEDEFFGEHHAGEEGDHHHHRQTGDDELQLQSELHVVLVLDRANPGGHEGRQEAHEHAGRRDGQGEHESVPAGRAHVCRGSGNHL